MLLKHTHTQTLDILSPLRLTYSSTFLSLTLNASEKSKLELFSACFTEGK